MTLKKADKVSIFYMDENRNDGVDTSICYEWFERDIAQNTWTKATWLEISEEYLAWGSALTQFLGSASVGSNLERLDIGALELDSDAFTALVNNPAMTSLEVLELGPSIAPEGMSELCMIVESPHLKNLHTLILKPGCITAKDVEALAADGRHWKLLSLSGVHSDGIIGAMWQALDAGQIDVFEMYQSSIIERDLELMKMAPCLAKMTGLSLLNVSFPEEEEITLSAVSALFSHHTKYRLKRLRLFEFGGRGHDFDTWSIKALSSLREVSLIGCALSDDEMTSLLHSTLSNKLTFLDLGYNDITHQGIEALATSQHVGQLKKLNLSHNQSIADTGADYLAASTCLNSLKALDMTKCGLSFLGARKILASSRLHVTDKQFKTGELIVPESAARLEGTDKILFLLESGAVGVANKLDLSGMPLHKAQIELIISHPSAPKIKALWLNQCGLTNEHMLLLLGEKSNMVKLTVLHVAENELTNDVGKPLAKLKKLLELKTLDLSYNRLGFSGFINILPRQGNYDWDYIYVEGNEPSSGPGDDLQKGLFDRFWRSSIGDVIDVIDQAR